VTIEASPKVKGADVIDVAKKVADKVAEKSGHPKARRVANTINAIDRARSPTVIKTDKIDARVKVTGNLDPIDPSKSRAAIEFKIKF
jgi:hypothetical protein